MALADLLTDPDVAVGDIEALLDAMAPAERWMLLSGLDRGQQRALYRKADPAIDLEHFVAGAGPLVEVIHDGVNTLPVPPRLRRFQKRFCRPGDGTAARLFGYNEGPTRKVIGPGYFVAVPDQSGGVVIDYFQIPDAPVAAGWPRVVPNSRGLQRFVYHQTRDILRRVCADVSIGEAVKQNRPLDHYFILCRRA